ncbi:hypothetical protein C8Q74DRAFT_1299417 [Fomes fomentarius]|nr:hypothetical protein C8Q74DRAFT_1299417 [Fomes fomentarius]
MRCATGPASTSHPDESHKRASVSDDSHERHTHGLDALSAQQMQSHTASRRAQEHEDAGS